MKVTIYTDGACKGNPGPGGWGAVLLATVNGVEHVKKLSGCEDKTTNQRMELTAVIEALKALKGGPHEVEVYSDSAYVVNAFNQNWIQGWMENGWKNSKGQPIANQNLWLSLIELARSHNVTFIKVKAHTGDKYNEVANTLAGGMH